MDLIIILVLITAIILIYRDVKYLVYLLGILEIFFRVIHSIGDNLKIIDFNNFVDKYIPTSLFDVFAKHTTGIIYDIISWSLVLAFCGLLYYLVKYMIKKK